MMEPINTDHAFKFLQCLPSHQRAYHVWHHTNGENSTPIDLHGYIKARMNGNGHVTFRMFTRNDLRVHFRPGTSHMIAVSQTASQPAPEHIEAVENNGNGADSERDVSNDSLLDLDSLLGASSGYQSEEYPWERDSDTSERQRRYIDQFEGNPILSRAPDDKIGEYISARGGPAVDNCFGDVLNDGGSITQESEPEPEYVENVDTGQQCEANGPSPLDAIDEMSKFERVRMWLESSNNEVHDINDSNSDTDLFKSGKREQREVFCVCASKSFSNVFASAKEIPFKRLKLLHAKKMHKIQSLVLKYDAVADCSSGNIREWDTVGTRKRKYDCDSEVEIENTSARPKKRRLVRYDT